MRTSRPQLARRERKSARSFSAVRLPATSMRPKREARLGSRAVVAARSGGGGTRQAFVTSATAAPRRRAPRPRGTRCIEVHYCGGTSCTRAAASSARRTYAIASLLIVVEERLAVAHVAVHELARFRRNVRELRPEPRRHVRARARHLARPPHDADRVELVAARQRDLHQHLRADRRNSIRRDEEPPGFDHVV